MQYRRAYVPGGSYFFTVVTEQRRRLFADVSNVMLLRQAIRTVMRNRPFTIDAIVVYRIISIASGHYPLEMQTSQPAGG
jgi:putative transposase